MERVCLPYDMVFEGTRNLLKTMLEILCCRIAKHYKNFGQLKDPAILYL